MPDISEGGTVMVITTLTRGPLAEMSAMLEIETCISLTPKLSTVALITGFVISHWQANVVLVNVCRERPVSVRFVERVAIWSGSMTTHEVSPVLP
jgi:hypothetical protein